MINTSIHGVTKLAISAPISMVAIGSGPYYCRTLTLATKQGKTFTIDMYGDTLAALTAPRSAEADYWRTQAVEESERADKAEELANEWMNKHAELYVASETDRQRANSAESRLAALQELLHKACDASGERVGGAVQP